MSTGVIAWLLTWAVFVASTAMPVGWLVAGLMGGLSGALARFTDRSLPEAFRAVTTGGVALFALAVGAVAVASVGGAVVLAVGGLLAATVLGAGPVGVAYAVLTRGLSADADTALSSVLVAWPVALAVAPVSLFVTGDLPRWAAVATVTGTPSLSVAVHVARTRLRG